MVRLVLCLAVTFTLVLGARKKLREGDQCKLRNGQKGMCRKLSVCLSALEDLDKDTYAPLYCRHQYYNPIICCDELQALTLRLDIVETTSTTTPSPSNEYGKKSREKCVEYSEWLEQVTLFGTRSKTAGRCGVGSEALIVGGEVADALEFPHMAHIGYRRRNTVLYRCGASLISNQYLLTAAHCLEPGDGFELTQARLGTGDKESEIVVNITAKIPHPKYKSPGKYDDIALLKLEKPLESFNDFMRPACIHTTKEVGPKALASGWGTTSFKGEMSEKLLKVMLPLVSHSDCIHPYEPSRGRLSIPDGILDETMVCAGGYHLEKDTCQGDSGGPLQTVSKIAACMYDIVGVTSFGFHCGKVPGVYTRVSAYVPWIESIVWPDDS